MAGFDNDVIYGTNIDLSGAGLGQGGSATLLTDGQMLIATTALNAGNTHVNVGTLTSPLGTLTIGYSTPNITIDLEGGGVGVDSFAVQTGTSPVVPTVAGLVTLNGAVVAAGTNPVRTDGTGANTIAIEVQTSQALAAADATKIGLSNFDSTSFSVAATGFVTLLTTGAIKTLTGNTGGAISPVANNINTVGTGSITIAGAGSTLTTQLTGLTNHAVLVGAGTATITNIAATVNTGAILQNNSGADPSYSTATYPSTTTVSQILYSSATNVVSGLATANSATLVTTSAGVPVFSSTMTNGQVIIGSTGATPTAATLSAGTGISITNAAGSITIATTGGGFTWTDVTSATQTLAVQNGYGTDRGAGVTYTLPATAAFGDVIKIVGKLGLTTIAQNANQQITIGSQSTTVGVGGSITGTNVGDCVTLRCTTGGASTIWRIEESMGNLTVV